MCLHIPKERVRERERERERNNILYKGKNEIVKGKFLLYLLDFHGWEKKRDSVVRYVLSVLLMSTAAVDCEKSILWLSFSFLFFLPLLFQVTMFTIVSLSQFFNWIESWEWWCMYRFHQLNSSSWLLLWTQLLHTKKELACAIINKFFLRKWSSRWAWAERAVMMMTKSEAQFNSAGGCWRSADRCNTQRHSRAPWILFFFSFFFLENGDPKDRSTCSVSQHVSIYSSFRLVFYCFIYFQNASLLQDASPVCFNNKASIVYVTDNGL